jgi:hypothetical protein
VPYGGARIFEHAAQASAFDVAFKHSARATPMSKPPGHLGHSGSPVCQRFSVKRDFPLREYVISSRINEKNRINSSLMGG